ncbi:unnamed protein product [Chrysodeixis includens]|uniref:Mpv17-like protein n=1 Tax=Chrysodeixis includens TaxID=689277 RepID=A0A9N8PZC0_CHRIL|nr:unnamed protein product [Chrysodeixis includens]
MPTAYSRIYNAFSKYPLLRGMASYSVIWPTSSLVQQTFERNKFGDYDWWRCARYGLYGSCYVAPTLYSWLTIANIMWPGNSIRAGIIKTFVETLTYTPFAMCSFYFTMSLLESKPFNEAVAEVEAKFMPTYKMGVSIWPAIAMINFCLIPPRNRVPFISLCSLVWTCFLAYMKHLDKEKVMVSSTTNPVKLLKATL